MADSWLPFDAAEYQRRQATLRARMDERGLDAVLLAGPENQYYVTGYETTGFHSFPQTLIVPRSAPPLLVTRRLEEGNAAAAYTPACRAYRDDEDPAEALALALHDLGLADKNIGVEIERDAHGRLHPGRPGGSSAAASASTPARKRSFSRT